MSANKRGYRNDVGLGATGRDRGWRVFHNPACESRVRSLLTLCDTESYTISWKLCRGIAVREFLTTAGKQAEQSSGGYFETLANPQPAFEDFCKKLAALARRFELQV